MKPMPGHLGPYEIRSMIAQGGMAVVYSAVDTRLGREVALKILPPYFVHDEAFVRRFLAEQTSVMGLNHPNIVRVYDADQVDGYYYIAFQLVAGGTLGEFLEQHPGPLDMDVALRIVGDIAAGLDYAHDAGVVHRDIKPSNILLAADGRALISDFGIAQPVAAQPSDATMVGYSIGTPAFMSPEQVQSATLDRRSDVYSLGVVAYLMITGSLPFRADSQFSLLNQIAANDPQDPRQHVADLPDGVAYALRRVLSKDPNLRYATAEEFAQALVTGRERPPDAEELAVLTAVEQRSSDYLAHETYTVRKKPKQYGRLALLLVLLGLVSLALGLFGILSPQIRQAGLASGESLAANRSSGSDSAPVPVVSSLDDAASAQTPTETATPLPGSNLTETQTLSQVVTFELIGTPTGLPDSDAPVIFDWSPIPALMEDFSRPSDILPAFDDGAIWWRTEDGAARLTIRSQDTVAWLPLDLDIGDFSVAIKAQLLNPETGGRWGLAFRANRMTSYYALDWLPARGLEVIKQMGEEKTVLLQRAGLAPDQDVTMPVVLAVTAVGPTMHISVNGQPIITLNDSSLVGGDIALYAVSDVGVADFTFDDLVLIPAKSESEPLTLVQHVDTERFFKMHVPEQWTQRNDESGVSFDSPRSLTRIAVYVLPEMPSSDHSKESAAWLDEFAQYYFEEVTVAHAGTVRLGSLDAYEQRGTARLKLYGLEVAIRALSIPVGDQTYAVVSVAEIGEEAVWRSLLEYVASTFHPLPWPTASPTTADTNTPSPTSTPTPTITPTATPKSELPPTPVKPGVFMDFEALGQWERGDEPYGALTPASDRKHDGSYSAQLAYDMPAVTNNYVVLLRRPPLTIPGQPDALNAWVYGDGSGHFLNAWIQDAQGEVRQFTFGRVRHTDSWQQMTLLLDVEANWPQGSISGPNNSVLDYPIRLYALVLDAVPDGAASKGSIYLDDLGTGSGAAAPPTPTTVAGVPPSQATPDPAGTTPEEPAVPPTPAPLSGRILYTTNNTVMALDVVSGNTWPVFSNGRQPDIRADGRVVVNGVGSGKENLYTINVGGGGEMMTGLHPEDSYPHWSPSGVSTVFHSTLQGDGRERIYIQRDMTRSEEPQLLRVGDREVYGRNATWLQDWRIAFTGCNYWASGGSCGIWVTNSNSSGTPLQLTQRLEDRSTDSFGGILLFSSPSTGNWEVSAISVNGGEARNLTNSPSHDTGATFSPDGSSIAFISNRDGSWGLWVMNADGSNPRKLLLVPNGLGSDWAHERLAWGP